MGSLVDEGGLSFLRKAKKQKQKVVDLTPHMKAFLKLTPANAAAAGEFGAWRG